MPARLKAFKTHAPVHGIQLLGRVEHLRLRISSTNDLGNPSGSVTSDGGLTSVVSMELGINYCFSRRLRLGANYIINVFDGNTRSLQNAKAINNGKIDEQEVLLRAAIAL